MFYDHDCPLAGGLRDDVIVCLLEAGRRFQLVEQIDAGRLSPTLLLDGVDVSEWRPPGHGCRLDRPPVDRIRQALSELGTNS